jgi:hypothetical protein
MAATERITMTMRELDRFKVIQDVADGKLKPWRAAERLRLTTRQIRRLVARLREHGPEGLVSRRRSRPSNNQLDAVMADRALSIIRDRYVDFGPTLACEKLYECHGIRLAKETVRRLMTDAGLWVPRRQRPPKIYQPRARRACLGELIQIDGCDHRWFEERAPACSLLVYVDDATSQLMTLHFTATESTFSYFEATRAYIERHGKPVAFYSDKYSVFRKTGANKDGNSVTHFGRAMYELNIDTFCANSSPAKGRVERAHLTLQDRLVKELRLRGISTAAGANAYAPAFMANYNARFAKPPKSGFDAHRPLRADENLDLVLTWREPRKVSKSLTVRYDRVTYLLNDTPGHRKLIGRYIAVWEYPDGRIELRAATTAPAIAVDPCGGATGALLQIFRELSAQGICHLLQDIRQENLRFKRAHHGIARSRQAVDHYHGCAARLRHVTHVVACGVKLPGRLAGRYDFWLEG